MISEIDGKDEGFKMEEFRDSVQEIKLGYTDASSSCSNSPVGSNTGSLVGLAGFIIGMKLDKDVMTEAVGLDEEEKESVVSKVMTP